MTAMKRVSVTQANQEFSRLLRQVEERGESFCILRRGRAVARLVPERDERMEDPEWRRAFARMMDGLERGAHLQGLRVSRDELHER